MITFEEAIKELNLTTEHLKIANPVRDAMVLSLGFFDKTFINLMLQNRDLKLKFDVRGYDETRIAIVFNDDSVRKYFPLMKTVEIVVCVTTSKTLQALYSSAPTPSHIEQEITERLNELSTALNADDITTPNQYTEFGQGARAALEAMSLCNDRVEADERINEIKAKSFKLKHFSVAVDRIIRMQVDVMAESQEQAEDKALEVAGSSKSYDKEWEDTEQDDEVIDVQEVKE